MSFIIYFATGKVSSVQTFQLLNATITYGNEAMGANFGIFGIFGICWYFGNFGRYLTKLYENVV